MKRVHEGKTYTVETFFNIRCQSLQLYKKYFPNGGGSIFTFEIKGDAKKAQDFIDSLE